MNYAKFIEICGWTKEKLWLYCKNLTEEYGQVVSLNILMTLRRDMQEQLAKYSKGKDGLDDIQSKAIWITEIISKWCSHYYKTWAMQEILKNSPELIHQRQKLKGMTGRAWEQYVRKFSY